VRNPFKKRKKEQMTPDPAPPAPARVPVPARQPAKEVEEGPPPQDEPDDGAAPDSEPPVDDGFQRGLGTIERLAKSARAYGPVTMSYVGITALLATAVVLVAVDMFNETEFLAVLAFSTIVLLAANALTFFQFRAAATRATMITQSKIDAVKEAGMAREKRLEDRPKDD